jgi:hypothetical protein
VNASAEKDFTPRRFNLGDGLILMGALALALERLRAIGWFQSFPERIAWCWQGISQLAGWSRWVTHISFTRQRLIIELTGILTEELVLRLLCPVLVGLMVAQPLIRLRRPRPPLSQLVRQSGFFVCMTCVVTLAGLVLIVGDRWFSALSLSLPLTRGILLFLIWPILGLPPWNAERSWIDRLGRATGWGWIVAMASEIALGIL